jgi:peptidoglycan/xylan/chitin deacetylase (PgdA/CDA1 family)
MPRRFLCLLLGVFSLFFPSGAPEEPVALPILMYHDVSTEHPGKDVVTPEELRADLCWLREAGYSPVTMARVIDYVDNGTPLPSRPVVLSFDDGYTSAYDRVLPLLREMDMPMVLSVIAGSADEFSAYRPGKGRFAHAVWSQLREMADSGFIELQNHSYALHRAFGGGWGCDRLPGESRGAYGERLAADVLLAQERIWTETGCLPAVFTYPYGRYGPESEDVLRELGFRATLTCDFGVNLLTRDPDCLYGLKRICRSHGADLEALLDQAYETLKRR